MKRKLLSTILLGLMTFSLASCTSVSNTTTKNDVTPGKTTEVPGSSTSDNTPGTTSNTPVSTSENIPTTTSITPSTTTGTKPTTTTGNIPTTTTGSTETTTSTTPIEEHTVSFYSDNVLIDTKTVKDGEKVSAIADPVKESDGEYNYTFDCWYYNNAAFNFNTEIKEDIVLTAKWNQTIIQYDFIIIDSISNSQIYSTKVNAKSKAKEPTLPAKSGYTFKGFYTDTTYSTVYDFNTVITKKTTIYAKYESSSSTPSNINVTSYKGFAEGAFIEFDRIQSLNEASDYDVYYLGPNDNDFVKVNDNLVRLYNSYVRADIVGLAAGNYTLRIVANAETKDLTVKVTQDDRSGYAHFNYNDGVGAYNNDGTLKENADVIYVSDATKNTVTYNGKTGLVNILSSLGTKPVSIRFIDTIKTCQWNPISYSGYSPDSTELAKAVKADFGEAESSSGKYYIDKLESAGANSYSIDQNNGITMLNGLEKFSWGTTTDSYWNMCDIKNASNVTLEGIGLDAGLFQWGLTWKNCSNIEVKNLTFDSYTEDACSFEGSINSPSISSYANVGRYWIHNNTFNQGKNNWDVSDDQDKHEGDGATDFKNTGNITISYNHYYNNHKTGLVGGDDTVYTANLTFHHNYYESCNSRLPLGRNANMHMYNNYYYGTTGTNMSIRARGYVFIENSVLEDCKNPFECKAGTKTGFTEYTGAVKSYNNSIISCSGKNMATVVSSRTEAITNDNSYGQTFDTDSSLFYYDETNKRSNVTILTDVDNVKTFVTSVAGAGALPNFNIEGESGSDTPVERFTVTFETNGGTAINSQTVISGNKISAVSTTKSGYKLVGWYKDATFSTPFNISTDTITEDTKLYAKWEESNETVYTFNNFSTGSISTATTVGDLTITTKSGKTSEIKTCSTTIDGTEITKYISFSGGGSYTELSIQFTLNSTSNVTVYYAASSGRKVGLFAEGGTSTEAGISTTGAGISNIVSYTFTDVKSGNYSISSTKSGMEIYAIVIS